MDTTDLGTKLDSIFAEEQAGSEVDMHYFLAFWKDESSFVSRKTKESLLEELKRFLKEVERSF